MILSDASQRLCKHIYPGKNKYILTLILVNPPPTSSITLQSSSCRRVVEGIVIAVLKLIVSDDVEGVVVDWRFLLRCRIINFLLIRLDSDNFSCSVIVITTVIRSGCGTPTRYATSFRIVLDVTLVHISLAYRSIYSAVRSRMIHDGAVYVNDDDDDGLET